MSSLPKGYCHPRNAKSKQALAKQQGTQRARSIRKYSHQRMSQLDGFDNFEAYLQHMREKRRAEEEALARSKTISHKNSLPLKPYLPLVVKENGPAREERQPAEAKPSSLFYRCQIRGSPHHSEGQFRIKRHSFKLHHTIMEENSRRGDRRAHEHICYA